MRKFKRGLLIGDLHSGHIVGLTPPPFQLPLDSLLFPKKLIAISHQLWDSFARMVTEERKECPFDFIVCNGDAIEGKDPFTGTKGCQLLNSDRNVQVDIAESVLKFAIGKQKVRPKLILIRGTDVHVSEHGEEFEECLFRRLAEPGDKIGTHEWLRVNGKVIDIRHEISSSSIPHGRSTPLGKAILWARHWAMEGIQPMPDLLVRSHVHYYSRFDDPKCTGITLPALKALGDKYGSKKCQATVHFGIVIVDIYEDGEIQIRPRFLEIPAHKMEVIEI